MHSVTRFESSLLKLLYYFLGREPAEVAVPLLQRRQPTPPCLTRSAVTLVQAALARGCVAQLARRGGWRRERHPRGDGVADGRLWQRTPPRELGLAFSRHTLDFLIWLTARPPGDTESTWRPAEQELQPGDLLLLFFAHEGLRRLPADLGADTLRRRPPLARHGLCRLAYPEDFAGVAEAPDLLPWTTGVGACILEALQPDLAARWVQVEAGKARLADPAQMVALGAAQERVLTAFLGALEQAGRWDLARFLLRAAGALLGPGATADMWVGGLRTTGLSLAERTEAYAAALALFGALERLAAWARRARAVGYFDEGYAAAQLWTADWERFGGDGLCERARAIRRQLDPLRQA